MSASFAQEGFDLVHLFLHFPVQCQDVLTLLIKLHLHLADTGLHTYLQDWT